MADRTFFPKPDGIALAGVSAVALAAAIGLTVLSGTAAAQDATWLAAPGTGDFNTDANWNPTTVPTGTAFFDTSNTTSLTFSAATTVGGWTFNAGADDFDFTNGFTLDFDGAGIVVNGGGATITNNSVLEFNNSSTAGSADITNNAILRFNNTSTAGSATITNSATDIFFFFDTSTAGSADITNNGNLGFFDASTAGSATITNNVGLISFLNTSTAGNADITNNAGGTVDFSQSTGPLANNELTAGSLAGAGDYFLGANQLTVGGNNLSSEVSGVIQDGSFGGGGGVGGSLVKTGTGTFTLSGANTYTGATTVNQGRLAVAGSIVSPTVTNNAFLDFIDTSTAGSATIINNDLLTFSGNSTGGQAQIINNGGLDFNGSSSADSATITNNLVGQVIFNNSSTAGSATINNAGLVAFLDTSTAGSATIVNNQDMLFNGNSTAGSAAITNNDDLAFFNTSTAGNATLINNAGGEIDFSNTTGPLGDGQISAGSIAGAGSFYLGARTLTVGGNNLSSEVSGVISDCGPTGNDCFNAGATGGSLVKTGTGTFTLSVANTYTGATTVNQGTLIVNGSIVSNVTVNGGTLGGSGTVGGLTIGSGGNLAPGNSIGTINATNTTFAAGSTYTVELNNGGFTAGTNNDLLDDAGTVTINGGTVHVTPENGTDDGSTYTPGTYTIITAATGVTVNNQFTVTDDYAFLAFTDSYDANNVYLTSALVTPAAACGALGLTANQSGACESALSIGSGDFYTAVLNLSNAEAPTALDLASGEIHASGQHVIDQTFALFSRTLRRQGAAGLNGGNLGGQVYTAPLGYAQTPRPQSLPAGIMAADTPDLPIDAYADERVANAWVAPLGRRGTVEGDGNAGELDWWTAGLAGGYEGPLDVASGDAWLGFGLGYLRSHGAVDARLSTLDADNFNIGVYGGWADGPWSLTGALGYMASRVETERRIIFGGIDRTATADYWNHTVGFSSEVAYGFNVAPGTTLSPLATLDAGWSGHGGFTETGAGALNLTAGSESWTRLDTGLGVAVQHVILTETGAMTFEARALWEHAFADVVPAQSLAFAGSPTGFTVNGPDAGRDRLRLGLGAAFEATEDLTIRASYTGLFSGNQQNHTANIGLNVRF